MHPLQIIILSADGFRLRTGITKKLLK